MEGGGKRGRGSSARSLACLPISRVSAHQRASLSSPPILLRHLEGLPGAERLEDLGHELLLVRAELHQRLPHDQIKNREPRTEGARRVPCESAALIDSSTCLADVLLGSVAEHIQLSLVCP